MSGETVIMVVDARLKERIRETLEKLFERVGKEELEEGIKTYTRLVKRSDTIAKALFSLLSGACLAAILLSVIARNWVGGLLGITALFALLRFNDVVILALSELVFKTLQLTVRGRIGEVVKTLDELVAIIARVAVKFDNPHRGIDAAIKLIAAVAKEHGINLQRIVG